MLPAWATSEHKHFLRFGADHFRPAAWRQAFRASRAADSAEKRSPPRSFRQDLPAPGHRSHRHTSILWALSPVPAARARPAASRNSAEDADRSRSGCRSNWPAARHITTAPHHDGAASRRRCITTALHHDGAASQAAPSRSISLAALRPQAPITPPPGWLALPHRNRFCTGVR